MLGVAGAVSCVSCRPGRKKGKGIAIGSRILVLPIFFFFFFVLELLFFGFYIYFSAV